MSDLSINKSLMPSYDSSPLSMRRTSEVATTYTQSNDSLLQGQVTEIADGFAQMLGINPKSSPYIYGAIFEAVFEVMQELRRNSKLSRDHLHTKVIDSLNKQADKTEEAADEAWTGALIQGVIGIVVGFVSLGLSVYSMHGAFKNMQATNAQKGMVGDMADIQNANSFDDLAKVSGTNANKIQAKIDKLESNPFTPHVKAKQAELDSLKDQKVNWQQLKADASQLQNLKINNASAISQEKNAWTQAVTTFAPVLNALGNSGGALGKAHFDKESQYTEAEVTREKAVEETLRKAYDGADEIYKLAGEQRSETRRTYADLLSAIHSTQMNLIRA